MEEIPACAACALAACSASRCCRERPEGEQTAGLARLYEKQERGDTLAPLVGCVLCLLCMASCALAQTDTYMDLVDAVYALGADHVTFSQDGDWLSAVLSREETLPQMGSVTQWEGVAYHLSTGEPVGWDEVFSDGDAAAARLEEIAQTALYANAYAEYSRFSPVPRDSFALENGQLTVYYPAEQFSHFSGVSGALSVYAYEMGRPALPGHSVGGRGYGAGGAGPGDGAGNRRAARRAVRVDAGAAHGRGGRGAAPGRCAGHQARLRGVPF